MSQYDEGQAPENLSLPSLNQAREQRIPGANEKIGGDSNISVPPSYPNEGNLCSV